MSGRRARKERKSPEQFERARGVILTAERMLAVDFSDVPCDHTRQVIVGWMRHAFEQSRIVAQLQLAGLGHAAAPNWRSFFETVGRLQWLDGIDHEDRLGAVDAMLKNDKDHVGKEVTNLRALGYESDAKLEEMESVILEVTQSRPIAEQARNFLEAAKAAPTATHGVYGAWRQETQYSHATAVLGGAYAPNRGGFIGSGRPPQHDPDLDVHVGLMMLVTMMTGRLLEDEGVDRAKSLELFQTYLG